MRAIAVLLVLLSPLLCLADGKFIPLGKLTEPTIPYQRAIVSYKGQTETLVVESVLNAPAGDYAWIVPVPSTPKVHAVTSGTLETMWQLVQPTVKMDDNLGFMGTMAVLVVILCYVLLSAGGFKRMLEWLLVLLAIAFLGVLFFPVFAGVKGGATPTAVATDYGRIGSYDVKVIRGADVAEIQTWLVQHGGKLPSEAESAIQAYAKEGWSFVVARLAKTKDGALIPHPLKLTFDTPKPVYPMRLTGAGASDDLQLDLYVIADKQAEVEGMRLWGCAQKKKAEFPPSRSGVTYDLPFTYGYGRNAIGHPELVRLMWQDCWLTHLHGTLSPNQMKADMPIQWKAPEEYLHTLYSKEAAAKTGIEKGLIFFMLTLFLGTIVASVASSNPKATVNKSLLALLPASILFGVGWSYTRDSVQAEKSEYWGLKVSEGKQLGRFAAEVATEVSDRDEAIAYLRKYNDGRLNGRVREGDVPNGYTFETKDDATYMTVYESRATPYTVKLEGAKDEP